MDYAHDGFGYDDLEFVWKEGNPLDPMTQAPE